jgi:hypothetical protein
MEEPMSHLTLVPPPVEEPHWTEPTEALVPAGTRVAAVAPEAANVEVGTYFKRSWGYDQTNVDFYRVVGLTAKGVRLQQWSSAHAGEHGHVVPGDAPRTERVWPKVEQADLDACERCRAHTDGDLGTWSRTYPAPDCPDHGSREQDCPVETKRLSAYPGGTKPFVAVGPYNDHAYPWDGKPAYETPAGMGH